MKKRFRSFAAVLLSVIMMMGVILVAPLTVSAASKTADDAISWCQSKLGQGVEYSIDEYRYQCVDFIQAYYAYLGVSPSWGSGYQYAENTLPAGWTRTYGGQPQKGDILVYTGGFGHVAIYESDYVSYHQNWSGSYVQRVERYYSNSFWAPGEGVTKYYWGCIHPNFATNGNGGPVDLGTDFYASISHVVSGKYVTAQTNGNANLSSDTNIANQYWKFFRQSDGSYIIKNAATGKCLDVSGTHDGANIQVWEPNGTDPQKWFIYPCGNGYQLQSKYTQSTNCVMEMNAWSFYEGVNLVSGSKDGSGAEIFAINLKDFNDIGKTNLNVKCKDGKAIFTWGDARCSTAYNIQIWSGNNTSGQPTYSLWNVKNNSFTYSLDEGTYTAYIECFNAFSDYVNSTPVTFKVANYNTLSPSASIEYNGHTYEFYNHTYTWYEAYLACEKLGGHLVTITSPEENNKVVDLVNGACNTVWIGSTKFSSSNWYWVNSEPYTENNFWASGEPNNTSGNEFFIHLYTSGANSGKWNDVIGDTENIKGFVCEYDDDIIADNYNPSQVIDHNGYRYELFDYSVDWQTAKRICEKKGGTLADITNAEQQEFIWNFTKQGSKAEYWIGLTDIKEGGAWQWVTGSDYSYSNWKPGTPDYDLGVESYGLIKQDDGTWNDLKGFSYAYHSIGFICKTPLHKIGDTNLDDQISIGDVTSIQRHIAELSLFTDEQLALADTNGDGSIDITDAAHLQKYIAGFEGVVLGKQ